MTIEPTAIGASRTRGPVSRKIGEFLFDEGAPGTLARLRADFYPLRKWAEATLDLEEFGEQVAGRSELGMDLDLALSVRRFGDRLNAELRRARERENNNGAAATGKDTDAKEGVQGGGA